MSLKSFIYKFFILSIIALTGSAGLAADDSESGDPSDSKACKDELRRAKDDLENIVYNGKNSSGTQTSSTDGQQQQQNPVSEMINQMAQSQQKQAELAQKAMEQNQQLDNERFKQLNEINDKIHEFQKGDFKRRMAIKDAETALKKQQSEIRIKCQAKAEADYDAEFARLNGLSATSNYAVSDMSRMSGSNKRMRASLAVYKRRCMSNPATREQLQNAQDEYDGKIHNFKIAAEEIASDVSYTESKIGLLEAHMADQKRQLASSLAVQQAALKQQQQMQMMGLMMGMMTSASGQSDQAKNDQEFRSADETLQKWEDILIKCKNPTSDSVRVPSDVYHVFAEVNDACRGDSGIKCVKDSNRESVRTPSQSSEL